MWSLLLVAHRLCPFIFYIYIHITTYIYTHIYIYIENIHWIILCMVTENCTFCGKLIQSSGLSANLSGSRGCAWMHFGSGSGKTRERVWSMICRIDRQRKRWRSTRQLTSNKWWMNNSAESAHESAESAHGSESGSMSVKHRLHQHVHHDEVRLELVIYNIRCF